MGSSAWEAFGQFPIDLDNSEAWDDSALPSLESATLSSDPVIEPATMFDDAFMHSLAEGPSDVKYVSSTTSPNVSTEKLHSKSNGSASQRASAHLSISRRSSSRDSSESSRGRKRKSSAGSAHSAFVSAVEPSGPSDWKQAARSNGRYGLRDSAVSLGAPFGTLSLSQEEDINKSMASTFDFDSAASSPGVFGFEFSPSLHSKERPEHTRDSSVPNMTVRPDRFMFQSRDTSPRTETIVPSYATSPTAMFSQGSTTPHSYGHLAPDQLWKTNGQQSGWPTNVAPNQLMDIGSSPMEGSTPGYSTPKFEFPPRPVLSVAPINPKSRVETQINIILTLSHLPPGVTKLHLPSHTISKPKLLAKETVRAPDTLELRAALVCTSAMEKEELKERAFRRARGEEPKPSKKPRQNSAAGGERVDDDDPEKPINGGEVKICQNCMNRERKRAGRKKPKIEEDEDRFNSYESQRVIVFNTKEYKEWQPSSSSKDSAMEQIDGQSYSGPMRIEAPMRIACYCRHQGEKIGFRVIFTITDYKDRVLAQQWTDSILITDDHKTQGSSATLNGNCYPQAEHSQLNTTGYLTAQRKGVQPVLHRPYHSTNDLQSLGRNFAPQFLAQGVPFQHPNALAPTVADSYPITNRSRQASPSAQAGPNKKRKSSISPHIRLPSALTMTPRVDPALAGPAQTFAPAIDPPTAIAPSGITQPAVSHPSLHAGPAAPPPINVPPHISSGPPTPGNHQHTPIHNQVQHGLFHFNPPSERLCVQPHQGLPVQFNTGPPTPNSPSASAHPYYHSDNVGQFSHHFSAPNSARPSRPPSPMAQPPPHAPQTQQNGSKPPAQFFLPSSSSSDESDSPRAAQEPSVSPQMQVANSPVPVLAEPPRVLRTHTQGSRVESMIYEVLPQEGPTSGGIKVNCLGTGFTRGMEVMFGDKVAITTTAWGDSCLVCLLPPAHGPGTVPVSVRGQPVPLPPVLFVYKDDSEQQLMETAIKVLCQKHFGSPAAYREYARSIVAGMNTPGGPTPYFAGSTHEYGMGDSESLKAMDTEYGILKCLDLVDFADTTIPSRLDLRSKNGLSMLSLACGLGYERLVAGLLARGANPDARDRNGFTPLMMASMRGHSNIVRRLILKGADPMLRSLQGYTAASLASNEQVAQSLQRIHYHHARSRSACALTLRSRPGSMISLRSAWEPPSPATDISFVSDFGADDSGEENEDQQSQHLSWVQSRRNSVTVPEMRPLTQPSPATEPVFVGPMAAVTAWRDHLAAQVAYFHRQFPNFQLPALPPMPNLPHYQAYPMVRRISSLVPQRTSPTATAPPPEAQGPVTGYRWRDMCSTPSLPPSYEEAVAEGNPAQAGSNGAKDLKKTSELRAATEAALDLKCAEAYDTVSGESSKTMRDLDVVNIGRGVVSLQQQQQMRLARIQKLKKMQGDRKLFFIWLPLLVFVLCAMLNNYVPQVADGVKAGFSFLHDRAVGLMGGA